MAWKLRKDRLQEEEARLSTSQPSDDASAQTDTTEDAAGGDPIPAQPVTQEPSELSSSAFPESTADDVPLPDLEPITFAPPTIVHANFEEAPATPLADSYAADWHDLPSDMTEPSNGLSAEEEPFGDSTHSFSLVEPDEVEDAPSFDDTSTEVPSYSFESQTVENQPFSTWPAEEAEPLSETGPISLDRETMAPNLVVPGSIDDIPKVAPFMVDIPPPAPSAAAQGVLTIRIGKLSAQYALTKDVTTIGRPDSALQSYPDVEVELDDAVSRQHAEIRQRDGAYALVDMGSTNGTLLNGDRLEPNNEYALEHGDRIHIGDRTEIIFE